MENNAECGMCSGRGWHELGGTRWRRIDSLTREHWDPDGKHHETRGADSHD